MKVCFSAFLIVIYCWTFFQQSLQLEACKSDENTHLSSIFKPTMNCCAADHSNLSTEKNTTYPQLRSSKCCIANSKISDFFFKQSTFPSFKKQLEYTSSILFDNYYIKLNNRFIAVEHSHLFLDHSPPEKTLLERLSFMQIWRI